LVEFYHLALSALGSGVPLEDIRAMPIITSIIRSKYEIPNTELDKLDKLLGKMKDSFKEIRKVKETETIVK
jgi:hypothetical protein